MPRRIQRPRGAADIARSEGLDLGDLAPTPRTKRRYTPRPASRSALRVVMDGLVEAGCTRQEAAELAPQWLEAEPSPQGVRRWTNALGVHRPRVAAQLRLHGMCADDLDVHIDGTTARQRLRNGESVGQVVASLLALRQPPT
ncbi:hypothetical protein ACFYYH_34180 [Streptomyces sp. NPDC002018]|uniref:hypothetical protein n=1 Tax=Streptomyces sp. NPDC002018 TaxID=3364629 RepID=UPI0036D0AB2B